MLWTLLVKPLSLAALAGVVWVLWRAGAHLDPAARRLQHAAVGAGAAAIALLVLGPPAWAALRERPTEAAALALGLALAAAAIWAYARLIAAARRRAGKDDERED